MVKINPDRLHKGEGRIIRLNVPSDEALLARSEDGLELFPIIKPQPFFAKKA